MLFRARRAPLRPSAEAQEAPALAEREGPRPGQAPEVPTTNNNNNNNNSNNNNILIIRRIVLVLLLLVVVVVAA